MHGIKHYHSVSDKINEEEFKDTKGIIRIRHSNKDRQHNN
jgi:hypothetical protein